jgi:hypothetical protein
LKFHLFKDSETSSRIREVSPRFQDFAQG